jgi:hypothetical protein
VKSEESTLFRNTLHKSVTPSSSFRQLTMRMSQVFSSVAWMTSLCIRRCSATNTVEFKTFTEINRQVDAVSERSISSTKMFGYEREKVKAAKKDHLKTGRKGGKEDRSSLIFSIVIPKEPANAGSFLSVRPSGRTHLEV